MDFDEVVKLIEEDVVFAEVEAIVEVSFVEVLDNLGADEVEGAITAAEYEDETTKLKVEDGDGDCDGNEES